MATPNIIINYPPPPFIETTTQATNKCESSRLRPRSRPKPRPRRVGVWRVALAAGAIQRHCSRIALVCGSCSLPVPLLAGSKHTLLCHKYERAGSLLSLTECESWPLSLSTTRRDTQKMASHSRGGLGVWFLALVVGAIQRHPSRIALVRGSCSHPFPPCPPLGR